MILLTLTLLYIGINSAEANKKNQPVAREVDSFEFCLPEFPSCELGSEFSSSPRFSDRCRKHFLEFWIKIGDA